LYFIAQGLNHSIQTVADRGVGEAHFFFHILYITPAFEKDLNEILLLSRQFTEPAVSETAFDPRLAMAAGETADRHFLAADRAAIWHLKFHFFTALSNYSFIV